MIDDLFEWLKQAKDHLLIRSCVFHYEFEFIHPFSDGNGRMGRLWQSLILGRLHPLFEYLPVENMVYANQEAYYNAIQHSTATADSGPFIEFMLQEILNTLKRHQGSLISQHNVMEVRDKVRDKFGISSNKSLNKSSVIRLSPLMKSQLHSPSPVARLKRKSRNCVMPVT